MNRVIILSFLLSVGLTTKVAGQCQIASVSGGGASCGNLSFSIFLTSNDLYLQPGVTYKLLRNGNSTTPVATYFVRDNDTPIDVISWSQSVAGIYTVIASGRGCNNTLMSGSATISTLTPTSIGISANGSTAACEGAGLTLTATGVTSYTWYGTPPVYPAVTGNPYTPTRSGDYWVKGLNNCGTLITSNVISVVITPRVSVPSVPAGVSSRCKGSGTSSYSSTALNANSYNWSVSGNGNSIDANGVVTWASNFTGVARVTVNASGCGASSASNYLDVSVTTLENATLSGTSSICNGTNAILTLAPDNAYMQTLVTYSLLLNGNPTPVATYFVRDNDAPLGSITWNQTAAGTYTVVASGRGCTNIPMSGSATISYKSPSGINVSASGNTTVCQGTPLSLSASGGSSYRWYSSPPFDQTIVTGSSIVADRTATYWATGIEPVCGTTVTSENISVTIVPLPDASVTPSGSLKIASDAAQLITAQSNFGSLYQWKKNGSSILVNGTSSTYQANSSGSYTVLVNYNTCINESTIPLILIINNKPNANAGLDRTITLPTNSLTLQGIGTDSDGSIASYMWRKISGPSSGVLAGSNSSNLSLSDLGYGTYLFGLTVTDDFGEASLEDQVVVKVEYPLNNYNWIKETTTVVSGQFLETQVKALSIGDKTEIWKYFDGLGRPMQTVSTQGSPSPSKNDIVQSIAYDSYGKESKKYLPVTVGTADGFFKPSLIDVNGNFSGGALNFYNNGLSDKIVDDARPYSETILEKSPLNRPLKDYGVGQAWAPVASGIVIS
jgi:hypothetical protein